MAIGQLWMNGLIDEWIWVDGSGWMDGMDGWTDGWMGEWGWMDGWMDL